MFATINDRLRKLETGPSGPQDTADAAQATAVQATVLATQATTAAQFANTQATTAIALAGTKNTVFYSGTAPTANAVNDQWIDTALGNKLFIWDGSFWVSAQDSAITAAQSTANGKNAIYRQGSTPTTPYTGTQFITGDMWFNTSSDNAISYWTGSGWSPTSLGTNALANFSANKITSGTIDASVVNVSNINAGNISTGYLAASRIQTGSLNASVITSGTITATQIAAGTITATQISSSYVYAGSIQATQITAGNLVGFDINNGSGTFHVDSSGNLTATSANITGTIHASAGTVGGFTIGSTYLSGSGAFFLNSSTGDATFNSVTLGFSGIYNWSAAGALTAASLTTSGTADIGGNLQVHAMTTYNSSTDYAVWWRSSNGRFYYNSSSRRYKENIKIDNTGYLSALVKLNPVSFTYKAEVSDTPNVKQFGLIAEDVDLIPELKPMVTYNKDNQPDAIAYDKLGVFTISALKEINDRLTKLEGK